MNPMELAQEIKARYQRYLKTTFYFRDPVLRTSFEEALKSGHLSKGPYLEATPVFKRGQAPRSLFPGLLGRQPDEGFLEAVQGNRPLYTHQEQAIQRVFQGHNVVVATGTGSGKTEAFLYPILLHLYEEFQSGKLGPGVRALILYPMNALANDQRDRLGEISKRLQDENSPFQFTFGQYIGETPEDENDSWRHAKDLVAEREQKGFRQVVGGNVVHGELVLRSEMRKTPPHILLTNYSMLEYLLLRPDDSLLFDNGQAQWWTFLVLDEAHQYRGSRGIEMAMLLRRLKRRLREGDRSKPFRCIATSATLAEGDKDKPAIAEFASHLFGEEFLEEDMILGDTEPIPEPGPQSLSPDDYQLLAGILAGKAEETGGRLSELADKLSVSLPGNEGPSKKTMGMLLQRDSRATCLRRLITANPTEVGEIADQVFDDLPPEKRASALSELVELLLQAKDPISNAPLLSARYHLFLRSLEGAFVSYWPEKKVFLDRKGRDGQYTAFEVALCRECGQHYFVGPKDFKGGNLANVEAIRDPSHLNFGATFFRPVEGDQDEGEEDENSEAADRQVFQLCVQCGEMGKNKPKCGHDNLIRVIKERSQEDEDRADQMVECGVCGYNAAGRDPVREVIHGTDGPHAVIATTLYQYLPEKRKKVLAFADGRQEAAFFAWYLEDSYKDILGRNLVLKAIQTAHPHTQEGLSLSTLAAHLFHQFPTAFREKASDDDSKIRANIWRALYREYLTDEQRISLEGVGLVRWSVKWPDWFMVPDVLRKSWSLTEQEAWDLMSILLDSMRTDRAVELRTEKGVSLSWNDLGLQASQMRFRIGRPARPKGFKYWPVRSWDGVDQWNHIRRTKRTALLAPLQEKSLSDEETLEQAVEALRAIWETIQRCEEQVPRDDRLLVPIDDARRLNPDWWRLRLITDDDTIFQCNTCGRLQTVSIRAVCPRQSCSGTLEKKRLKDLEPNHYRLLYEEKLPGPLLVEEHTAQLDHEKAREFQKDFKEGKIHVLSCSTTFELGVDLGDLDTIFLRNVPPEAFNYAQRVGRAGRRERPGFAITYCRRGPHDLYHFAEPERMLSGKVRPPALSIRNEKIITRHIAATALSRFFRAFPGRFKREEDRSSRVERLFVDMANPSAVADFKAFLYEHQTELEESFRAIVPHDPEIVAQVGLDSGTWIDKVAGENSRFSDAEVTVSSDYQNAARIKDTAKQRDDFKTAEWAKGRLKDMTEEDVLSFLSRKAVIPKYGFPVDVVELDTQRTQHSQESMQVSLQRDLTIAIAEFAPTNKLVANKKVWTSYGLKKVAEKEWERWWYARCATHNRFERKPYQKEKQAPPFEKCCERMVTGHQYIEPKFGFVTSTDKPEEPRTRPARAFTTRPYFAGFRDREGDKIDFGDVRLTPVLPGYMVVLCEGRRGEGFFVCEQCGAGFRGLKKTHKTPYGQDCHGRLDQVSLGHEFVTDVLQILFHPEYKGKIESGWFAYSLAYALVEGASGVLDVPFTDLSATVAYGSGEYIPPIILYDNVPGGAGLVARLEEKDELRKCLEIAKNRVSRCTGCGESSSCYSCLRNYRNQFAHPHLQRGPVMHYLEVLLSRWK
jgi:superfamily II DNA/RNA helicase